MFVFRIFKFTSAQTNLWLASWPDPEAGIAMMTASEVNMLNQTKEKNAQ